MRVRDLKDLFKVHEFSISHLNNSTERQLFGCFCISEQLDQGYNVCIKDWFKQVCFFLCSKGEDSNFLCAILVFWHQCPHQSNNIFACNHFSLFKTSASNSFLYSRYTHYFKETFLKYFPDHLSTSKTYFSFLESSSFYHLSHCIVLLRKLQWAFSCLCIRNIINSNQSDTPLQDIISKGDRSDTGSKKVLHLSFIFYLLISFPFFSLLKEYLWLHIFRDFSSS